MIVAIISAFGKWLLDLATKLSIFGKWFVLKYAVLIASISFPEICQLYYVTPRTYNRAVHEFPKTGMFLGPD
jgi:hypothetical protein